MQVNKTQTRVAVRAKRREKIGKRKKAEQSSPEPNSVHLEAKAVDLARSADLSDEQGVLKF